ncbi:C-type lectin domain family 4 member E-like [Xiphophorus maculatus]|uniref:C-type lectin domain family 4 member E-like n=1 Tax=Xiphophorus maculatus TaxID=8083 RepID=UPI000C6CFB23|nr:C-type lectin domain family 4 member E-like [Xiphophorus maculatus]
MATPIRENGRMTNVTVNQQEGDEEPVRGENISNTSKLPAGGVVLLVLVGLLAAALIIIFRLYAAYLMTNKNQREEKDDVRKHVSVSPSPPSTPHYKTEDVVLLEGETCLKCAAGWEQHGGKCYYFYTVRSAWTESRRFCQNLGSDLVKIDSREEQMFLEVRLRALMEHDEDRFWIGLTDSEVEGRFLWVDGSPLDQSLSFWGWRQPDNWSRASLKAGNCVRMGKRGGSGDPTSWFDTSCSDPQKSICEQAGTQ